MKYLFEHSYDILVLFSFISLSPYLSITINFALASLPTNLCGWLTRKSLALENLYDTENEKFYFI